MNQYKDKHIGETCFVIGNGPSLKDVHQSIFGYYPTFGTNRCYLRFIPDYYVAINPLVLAQNIDDIAKLPCPKFVREEYAEKAGGFGLVSTGRKVFSYNPRAYVYEGFTVTYVALQLAFYMGFEVVLLLGIDHRYEFEGKPNEKRVMQTDDPNHFDADYFKGQEWHNPDLERSRQAYELANETYINHKRRILNLTEDTALDVFEKDELRHWI